MDAPDKSAASIRVVDAVTALVLLGMGGVVIYDSLRLGASWDSDGPQSGYFPFYIGLFLCVASLINFVQALRDKSGGSFVSVSSLKMIFAVLVPTIVYVALIGGVGPVPKLGIYVASAIFIAFFMKWLGKYAWLKTLAVSIAVPAFFYVLFEVWFKVPLPKGVLEAALGLD